MGKTIVAVTGGVVLGLAIAFANAGAFQFPWGSGDNPPNPKASSQSQAIRNRLHEPSARSTECAGTERNCGCATVVGTAGQTSDANRSERGSGAGSKVIGLPVWRRQR